MKPPKAETPYVLKLTAAQHAFLKRLARERGEAMATTILDALADKYPDFPTERRGNGVNDAVLRSREIGT